MSWARGLTSRLRRGAVPLALVALTTVVAVVFRQRLADWFGGRTSRGAWSTPTRVQVGALTVEASLQPDPPRQNGNRVRVQLADSAGSPVNGATVKVTYDMPAMGSMPEMKGSFPATARGAGRYEGGFDLPMGGSWGLFVDVEKGQASATARYSFTVGTSGLVAQDGDTHDAPPAAAPAIAGTQSYPPAALSALQLGFASYARLQVALSAGLVDQDAARRLALALRDAQHALGQGTDAVGKALAQSTTAADAIAATEDLAAARAAFAELNRALVDVVAADARLAADWRLFECPMAPTFKRWFQKEPAPTNPYLGREMAACVSEVPWTAPAPPAAPADTGEIRIDDARRQVIGLRTERVVEEAMALGIRAVGKVTYDEARLTDVSLRVGGFITDLRVATTGRAVKKGETLFTLYSPELYAAQQEYLAALRGREAGGGVATASEALVKASEKKLLLWGLSAAQLAKVAASGEPIEDIPFASPASGTIIEKNVVEGAAVDMGMRIFRIAALDTIWVEAELYEPDLRHVRAGTPATIALDYAPGDVRKGKVTFVYPYLDPLTRTGRVRIELPNRGLALKPDMYATVELDVALGARVQVPTAAIIYTGRRRVVFVDVGRGKLQPRLVTVGASNADRTEVLEGLVPGDVVVTSGNFLVASESRLRSTGSLWSDAP